jgi:2',3'-cyclic-nucleotide 2'-phosphodiesterase (5'-nucleotidase family)
VERLKAFCNEGNDASPNLGESFNNTVNACTGSDLWFVVNGDWIDGTGLAMDGDPSYLIPILEKMPFDLLNVGNHGK